MADYVLARKSRNIATDFVHIFLNILLGVGTVIITFLFGSPWPGIVLVLASKWRIFAVRSRYILPNLKANLVDIIVGLSVVLLTSEAGDSLQLLYLIGMMAFYPLWLIMIKPLTSESANSAQSLIAVFLGISAASLVTAGHNSIWIVVISFLIGYAASRHVLIQSNDKDFTLTTLVCGLIFAETAWLCNTWSIIYTYEFLGLPLSSVMIPQSAIILTIFFFVYDHVRYAMIKYQDDFRFVHILMPVLYGILLIGVIVICFSDPRFSIIKPY